MWYFILLMVIIYVDSFSFLHKTKHKEVVYTDSSIKTYELTFPLSEKLLNSGDTLQTSFDSICTPYSITADILSAPGNKDAVLYQFYEIFVILTKYKTTIDDIQKIIDDAKVDEKLDSDEQLNLEIEANYLDFKIKNFQAYSEKILPILNSKTKAELLSDGPLLTNLQVLTELLILDFRQLYKRVRELYMNMNLIKKGVLSDLLQNMIYPTTDNLHIQYTTIYNMVKVNDHAVIYVDVKSMTNPCEYVQNKPIIYYGLGIKGKYYTSPDNKYISLPNTITDFIGDNPKEIKCLEGLNQNKHEIVIQNCQFVPFIHTFSEADDGIYFFSATQDTLNNIAGKGMSTANFPFPSKITFSGNLTITDNNQVITLQDNNIPSLAKSSLTSENLNMLKDLAFQDEIIQINSNIFSYIAQEWKIISISYGFFSVSAILFFISKYLFKKCKYMYKKKHNQSRSTKYVARAIQARARNYY